MFIGDYIKSNVIKPLDRETFERYINEPRLAALDNEIAALNEAQSKGEVAEADFEAKKLKNKHQRPYLCTSDFEKSPQGLFIRSNKYALWSGLSSLDIDHIDDPQKFYEERIKGHEAEWGIVAVFISPSQRGLKIIFRIAKDVDIAEAQRALAQLIGTPFDACTKDPARCTFLVGKEQWVYLDEEGMFTKQDTPPQAPRTGGCSSPQGAKLPTETQNDEAANEAQNGEAANDTQNGEAANQRESQTSSQGDEPKPPVRGVGGSFDYAAIVAAWWELHGTPSVGVRHASIYQLAYNLKFICENDPQMTYEAIKTHDTFGKPDQEVMDICKDVCAKRSDHLYMPKELKAVMKSLSPSLSQGEGAELPSVANSLPLGGRLEGALASLPIGIKDSLENLPPSMQMPVLVSLLPMMAAYADGVKARYADGRLHPLALMSIVVGEMASGKSTCKDIADVWLEQMREDDAEQRRIEEEWKQQNKGRKANEKAKPDPEVVIREIPITTSCSTLLKRLKNSKGHTLYSFDEELDTLHKTNSAGNWSAKYDIYRKAFDNSMWGQDYNSDQATSGMARVAYNWSILGTYGAFRKCFKGESVENGLASRIIISEMPDNKFSKLTARKQLSPEQWANIQEAVKILKSAKGNLEVPKLRYMMEEWVEDKRIEALKNADELKDAFRKRAAVIGFRAGVLYFLLEREASPQPSPKERGQESPKRQQSSPLGGELERGCSATISDSCCRFAQLIAQYTLDEQMRLFGEQFKQASDANERCQYGTGNQELLDALPEIFDIKDIQKLKGSSYSKNSIYTIVKRWVANDLVKKQQNKHSWKKL